MKNRITQKKSHHTLSTPRPHTDSDSFTRRPCLTIYLDAVQCFCQLIDSHRRDIWRYTYQTATIIKNVYAATDPATVHTRAPVIHICIVKPHINHASAKKSYSAVKKSISVAFFWIVWIFHRLNSY